MPTVPAQLATTRLLERDALVRQVKQLEAQLRHTSAMKRPQAGQDTAHGVPSAASKGGVAWSDARGRQPSPLAGGGGGGGIARAGARGGSPAGADDQEGGGSRQRRPAVPRRHEGMTPSLIEEENSELREALNASRHERDVLQCEVHAMRLELETTRELLQ